jgi:hypothetical protein
MRKHGVLILIMADQRIEMRPAFSLKNCRHGFGIGGISAQAVNRLGAEGDQSTGRQQRRSVRDIPISAVKNFSHAVGHPSSRL